MFTEGRTCLCLLELTVEALALQQLSIQNPPEAHLDGYTFRQVHPLGRIILIDKLICDTPLIK